MSVLQMRFEDRYTARMGIPNNTIRFVMSGAMPGGDIWASSFWMDTSGHSGPLGTLQSIVDSIATALTNNSAPGAAFVTAEKIWSPLTNLQRVTAYQYDGSGSSAAASAEHIYGSPLVGSSGSLAPNQVALVVSLRTPHPGRSYRGRMFLPCTAPSLDPTGQLDAATTSQISVAWANIFSQFNGLGYGSVVVVSPKRDATTDISAVIVNSRLDIMRSRANKEVSEHSYTNAVAGG